MFFGIFFFLPELEHCLLVLMANYVIHTEITWQQCLCLPKCSCISHFPPISSRKKNILFLYLYVSQPLTTVLIMDQMKRNYSIKVIDIMKPILYRITVGDLRDANIFYGSFSECKHRHAVKSNIFARNFSLFLLTMTFSFINLTIWKLQLWSHIFCPK